MSKSQTKASNKYNAKAYDRIAVQVYKGSREIIQAAASRAGESTNAYILGAIDSRMKSEGLDGLPSRAAEASPAPEVAEIVHEMSEEIPTPPKAPTTSEDISVLDLSVRTFNIVCRAGVRTVAELEAWVHSDQCCLEPERSPGYKEILEALEAYKENTRK